MTSASILVVSGYAVETIAIRSARSDMLEAAPEQPAEQVERRRSRRSIRHPVRGHPRSTLFGNSAFGHEPMTVSELVVLIERPMIEGSLPWGFRDRAEERDGFGAFRAHQPRNRARGSTFAEDADRVAVTRKPLDRSGGWRFR